MQESEQENGNSNGILFADFSITETQTTVLDKKAAPCKLYNDENDDSDDQNDFQNDDDNDENRLDVKMKYENCHKTRSSTGETEFTKCFIEKFQTQLRSQVNCSTPYFDDFLGENQLEECKTKEVTN
jgi:hypothetical protein